MVASISDLRFDECCDLHWPGDSRKIHVLEHQRDALLEAAQGAHDGLDDLLNPVESLYIIALPDHLREQLTKAFGDLEAAIAKAEGQ